MNAPGLLITPPQDQIVITIDNTTGKAQMKISRDLPAPYVCLILAQLIAQTEQDVLSRLGQGPVAAPPAMAGPSKQS